MDFPASYVGKSQERLWFWWIVFKYIDLLVDLENRICPSYHETGFAWVWLYVPFWGGLKYRLWVLQMMFVAPNNPQICKETSEGWWHLDPMFEGVVKLLWGKQYFVFTATHSDLSKTMFPKYTPFFKSTAFFVEGCWTCSRLKFPRLLLSQRYILRMRLRLETHLFPPGIGTLHGWLDS